MRKALGILAVLLSLGFAAIVVMVIVTGRESPERRDEPFGERPPEFVPPKPDGPPKPVAEPKRPPTVFEQAVAKANARDFVEAKRLLNESLASDGSITSFVLAVDKSIPLADVYAICPEPSEAFAALVDRWLHEWPVRSDKEVARLLDAHAATEPDDPTLALAKGKHAFGIGDYAAADAAYRRAVELGISDAQRDSLGSERIESLYRLGKIDEALKEFQPYHETFQQIAGLCRESNRLDQLEELIAKEKPTKVDDWMLDILMQLRIDQDRPKDAVVVFRERVKLAKADPDVIIGNFGYSMLAAGHVQSTYDAVADIDGGSEIVARNLGTYAGLPLLEWIEIHRRTKPDDANLPLWQSDAYYAVRAYEKAGKALAEAPATVRARSRERNAIIHRTILARGGRWREAAEGVEKDRAALRQIAESLGYARRFAQLKEFLAAHGATAFNPTELRHWTARERIQAGAFDEAKALVQDLREQEWESMYLIRDYADKGRLVEGYKTLKTHTALSSACDLLRFPRHADELEKLLAAAPQDIDAMPLYRARLLLLRGDAAGANALLTPLKERWREGSDPLRIARVKLKRTVETYREFPQYDSYLYTFANACIREKDADELEALLRIVHPKHRFEEEDIKVLRVIALALRGGDEAFLRKARSNEFGFGWTTERMRKIVVRTLLHQGKRDEAESYARRLMNKDYRNFVLDYLLTQAAWPGTDRMLAAFARLGDDEELVRAAYEDEELGDRLRTDEYRTFRDLHPLPK